MDATRIRSNEKVYLIAGRRTPFGRFGGSLKDIKPVDLSVIASTAAMQEARVNGSQIDHVILANVVPSSTDTMYGGRHLALKVGAPVSTPGYVINRLCGSGIEAILAAARHIKMNEADCVLVSGTENMSMVPHLVYGSRFGTKYGSLQTVDMLLDALTDQYAQISMGLTAENLAQEFSLARNQCDQFAYRSHEKATKAYQNGHLQGEMAPVSIKGGALDKDEHLREDASMEEMAKLRASFKKDGTVTPGNASGIVDGAASVLVASESFCQKHGITPLARIIDGTVVGVDPTKMGIGPSPAISLLLAKNKLNLKDVDFVEINEAFAAQTLSCAKDLDLDQEKLNVWGGAVALGHPLGASGVRITLTLARQLRILNGKIGVASACIGGGQGISLLLEKTS